MKTVIVVGAGWAGLSAAVRLTKAGQPVHLLEAAPQAGGRARRQQLRWADGIDIHLDNGQHLLLAAYHETLALVDELGGRGLKRVPLDWQDAAGLRLRRRSRSLGGVDGPHDGRGMGGTARRMTEAGGLMDGSQGFGDMTGLWHRLVEAVSLLGAVLGAEGLSLAHRARLVQTLLLARLGGWRCPVGVRTVADWFAHTRQPDALIRQLWRPLVVSAMNTPPEAADAATFLRVLRDALGGQPTDSDFVLADEDLGALLVDPAMDFLKAQQMPVWLRSPARSIERDGEAYRVRVQHPERGEMWLHARQLVIATPPLAAARLLQGLGAADHPALAAALQPLQAFDYRPISTAYVGWPTGYPGLPARLPTMFSLAGGAQDGPSGPAHWFFARGEQAGWRLGAMVVSDSEAAQAEGAAALEAALQQQLIRSMGLPPAVHLQLIHEKRATLACTPDRPRVEAAQVWDCLPGIVLAGDYCYPDYPATLEGAVRSGRIAAQRLMKD